MAKLAGDKIERGIADRPPLRLFQPCLDDGFLPVCRVFFLQKNKPGGDAFRI